MLSAPSVLQNAFAAVRVLRLRVSIESIVRAMKAMRLISAEDSKDSVEADDPAIGARLLRNESFVTDLDQRYDTASSYERVVLGEDRMELGELKTRIRGKVTQQYGERCRTVRRFNRVTDNQETVLVGNSLTETVHGQAKVTVEYSAESIVGGAYVNTISPAYLRIAGWIDCMAWGGWIEADATRWEFAPVMIRTHVGYAHTAIVRSIVASRMVDDYVNRSEYYGVLNNTGVQAISNGGPGSGIENEA